MTPVEALKNLREGSDVWLTVPGLGRLHIVPMEQRAEHGAAVSLGITKALVKRAGKVPIVGHISSKSDWRANIVNAFAVDGSKGVSGMWCNWDDVVGIVTEEFAR